MDGFNNLLVNVIGDVMVSAGVVAYLGAFTVRSNYYQGRIQGGGLWGLQPPQMILGSPAHLGLKYESRPVFLTGP